MESIYHKLAELETSGENAALCTVVNTSGSTPRKTGAKMIVLSNRRIFGSVGGGELEMRVIDQAVDVIEKKKPAIFRHTLLHDHGMCCGGTVEIFIEPVVKRKKLFVFGAGHIGKALAGFAAALDFAVSIIDGRDEVFDHWDSSNITTIQKKHKIAIKELQFDPDTFVAVITHNHAYDREIVAQCATLPHAYLGMIGSMRKVEMAKKSFRAGKLLTEKQMEGIDWPMGVNIKVQTPEEIAISILAKLIDVRSGEV